jgi:radical SAM superfamily enzyme YgiQ (UPF0313 family)
VKVFVTHGYFLEEDEVEKKIMKPYPPLGLLYVSAYLKREKVDTTVFDATFESESSFFKALKESNPDVIAFYCNLMTKIKIIKLIKQIRQLHPNAKIVIGGPDVTYNLDNYLNHCDFAIIGEGEQTMFELVKAIENNEDVSNVTGIAFKLDGELIKTPGRTKIKEIDELPLPDRASIDLAKYSNTWKKHHGKATLNISTQRGCPYTCKWCSTAVYGQSYRRRSPKLVVDEIILLQEVYEVEALWFVDDVFTVSHKWIKAFHEEITSRNVKVKFECITRAERLTEEIIELLKESGCFRVWIGAESGSQKIIDKMDRKVDVNVVREMIQLCNKKGIETGTFIMVGYPGETKEDVNLTIDHLIRSNPTQFTITVAYPIKGTSLYNEIEDQITTSLDWSISSDRQIDFKRNYPRKYFELAVRKVVNKVNGTKATSVKERMKLKSKARLVSLRMGVVRVLGV